MAMTRVIGLLAAGIWIGVWAAGPAAADGLARFEKAIKPQIPPGTFSYKSGKGLGDNGFVLEGVVVTSPPDPKGAKSEPIQIKTITVEDLDFASIEKETPPLFAKIRIDGISVGSNPAAGVDLKQFAGLDKLSADFQLDYKLEPDRKVFTLNRMELNLLSLGRVELTMVLDGVNLDSVAKPDSAMDDAALRTASFVYDDHSLLSIVVPIAAAMQGTDPAAMIGMARTVLDTARAGQGPAATAAIDSLVAYLDDYQKPKGPLRLTFNPTSKASAADLSNAKTADDMVKALGLEVSYAGTRAAPPADVEKKPEEADKPLEVEKK